MTRPMSIPEVLVTAITREPDACFFDLDLAEMAEDKAVKDTLQFIASKELKHRRFLVDYRSGKHGAKTLAPKTSIAPKIAEHLDEPDAGKPLTDSDIYLIGAHRECRVQQLSTELANLHPELEIKALLQGLASEKGRHRAKTEGFCSNASFAQMATG